MKGKSVAILFLFILIVPPVATIGWLRFEKYQLRRQIKRQIMADIDRNELVKFKFSAHQIKTELDWEHSKEFEYQGEMYDVVHREELQDSIVFWCWWDHEETSLNIELVAMTNRTFGNDTEKSDREAHVITFIKSLYSQEKMKWESEISSSDILNQTPFLMVYSSITSIPPSPPPNLS